MERRIISRMRLSPSELRERARVAAEQLASCVACAHACGVDRRGGPAGVCRMDGGLHVAGWGVHFGEEPPLVGKGGSGMVLLAGCNLDCVYCETASFSLLGQEDHRLSEAELASVLLELQRRGAENAHFVSPTHQAPQILGALAAAAARGLTLPVVWNCGGYESLPMLRLLDGVVDIYLPDAKYGDEAAGRALSGSPEYPRALEVSLREMHRQVGALVLDERGVAIRGMIVRHLVLPGDAAGGRAAMEIVSRAAPGAILNVMAQYRPCHRASGALSRRPTAAEVQAARDEARAAGLTPLGPVR